MRSTTQNIVLDRLQKALASRGVDWRRSAILEIASETFGFLDGNAFVAAMKEGRFDPPAAEMLGVAWHDGQKLTVLRDPLSDAVYALETEALPAATRHVRLGVSPYGGLLRMPDDAFETAGAAAEPIEGSLSLTVASVVTRTLDDGRTAFTLTSNPDADEKKPDIVYVVDNQGGSNDPEVAEWRHLLTAEDDIHVHCDPVHWADAWRMARVDGRLHFAITAGEEYDGHEQAVLALRSFQTYVEARAEAIGRVGGIIRCHDDTFFGRIELEVMLPVDLAAKVDDIRDWHEAIAILLGADHEAVTARFGPQTWVKDDALDTDPEGETDIDVTVEVLLMGSKAARAVEDYRDSSDEFQMAVLAPDWIRNWKGPFYVEVADGIADYLDDRRMAKEQDADEEWSCDNCGETAQDGSGVCITCGLDSNEGQAGTTGGDGPAPLASPAEEDDDNADDRPDDSVCDDCDQTIDYDTGRCSGCGRDWSEVEQGRVDAGVLRTVLPDDVDHLKRQPDIGDPV